MAAGALFEQLRSVKDPAEQDALRAAGAAVDRVLASCPASPAVPGVTEREVGHDLERLLISCGHDAIHEVIVGSAGQRRHPAPHGQRPRDRAAATRS